MEVVRRERRVRQWPCRRLSPVAAVKQPAVLVLVAIAGAHHEQANRRIPIGARIETLQESIEPPEVERLVEVGDCRRRTELDVAGVRACVAAVDPRSDDELHRRCLDLRQAIEVQDGPAGIRIVPARQMDHRDVRRLVVVQRPVAIGLFPVVVVLRVRHDLEVVLLEAGRLRERRLPPGAGHSRNPRRGTFRRRELRKRPRRLLRQLEGAVIPHLVEPAVVETAAIQDCGPQMGRVKDGRASLRVRRIRRAPHRHLPVGVGLRGQPFDRVVAILTVPDVLALNALGVVRAALVLERHDVALAGEVACLCHRGRRVLVVRRALQQHWQPLRDGRSTRRGAVDVGGQPDPVTHRNHDVSPEHDDVRCGSGGGRRLGGASGAERAGRPSKPPGTRGCRRDERNHDASVACHVTSATS